MLKTYTDLQELYTTAAALFVQAAKSAISQNGRFTVALTGGSSPVETYRLLATPEYRDQVQWEHVYIFWGDERWVPMDDDRSNARMAFETLLNHIPVPKAQVFPMWAPDVTPEAFAEQYEQTLRQHLGKEGHFDLILLGMGADGHTASWFPHTAVINEREKWVAAYYLQAQNMYRITLTVPLVNQARQIVVIAYGANKADALFEVWKGERNPEEYPAQLVDTAIEGRVTWLVDADAAANL